MIDFDSFAEPEDIMKFLKKVTALSGGGPILYYNREASVSYCLPIESNTIYLGVTGCGKTRRGTIPLTMSIIQNSESFVSVDPKGDILKYTYSFAKKMGYHIKIFNFRDILKSDSFDLLGYPYELSQSEDPRDRQLATDILDDMAEAFFLRESDGTVADPFWTHSAHSLFLGAALILFFLGKKKEINLNSLVRFVSEAIGNSGNNVMLGSRKKPIDSICELFPDAPFTALLNNVRSAPHDTLGSILSSFFEPLNFLLKSEGVRDLISADDFSISSLDGKSKEAIYIVLPDENSNYSSLAATILNQFVAHYIRMAHLKYDDHLPRRMNIILEELGSVGTALPKLDHLMAAGRSRNLRTFFVVQSLSQINDIYGASKASSIISNADTFVSYRVNHWATLEDLSRKCGEIYDHETNQMRRLVTPTQLASLDTGEVLVNIRGSLKYVTQIPDFTEMIDMTHWKKVDHQYSIGKAETRSLSATEALKRATQKRQEKNSKPRDSTFDLRTYIIDRNLFSESKDSEDEEASTKHDIDEILNKLNKALEAKSNKTEEESGGKKEDQSAGADGTCVEKKDLHTDGKSSQATKMTKADKSESSGRSGNNGKAADETAQRIDLSFSDLSSFLRKRRRGKNSFYRIFVTGHDTSFANAMSIHKCLQRFCSSLNYLDHCRKIECVTPETKNALKIVQFCRERGMSIEMYLVERSK